MATVSDMEVPILDLAIQSGSKRLDVSLWRDQALNKIHLNDKLKITRLKGNSKSLKFNSTMYTTIEKMLLLSVILRHVWGQRLLWLKRHTISVSHGHYV
ncbi:hypothetical protein DPX16_22357 [Anabarilius grahami]|uniref:Uncharacterized protein n=1 Tax=Anabarilius grahami TaxID=495550 RepID=A0A3N0Y499_ANAGA|nr:hypothetical protein DPX16_22357 [Anabarilius grahami]